MGNISFKNQLLTLFIIAVFIACNSNNNRVKYETINIAGKELILQQLYDEKGNLMEEKTFEVVEGDTIFHGIEKGYFENGKTKHTGWNNKGEKDSIWVEYYNKALDSKEQRRDVAFWRKGKLLSHNTTYYESGNPELYVFYDPMGRPRYKREFKESGIYLEEGSKNPHLVMVNTKNNQFDIGDTLKARIYHIKPPKTEATIFIRIKGLQNDWEMLSSSDYYTVHYESPLNKEGAYKLELKFHFKDLQNQSAEDFMNEVEFTVR